MGFSEGDQYFVCGVAEHCREGNMKLHVRVSHHCSSPPPPPPSSCECGGGWTWPRVTTPSPLNPPRNVDWKLDMSDQESNICVRPGETLSIGSSVLKMNVLCIFLAFRIMFEIFCRYYNTIQLCSSWKWLHCGGGDQGGLLCLWGDYTDHSFN